ncbi:MAG: hypothetical protein V4619_01410 [Bacteroidota bacterium]
MSRHFIKLIVIILVSTNATIALAQQSEIYRPNQIFVSPLRAFADIVNPGIEVGYQRAYGKNLATAVSVARMTDAILKLVPENNNTIDYTNYKGWRFMVEQRYFLTDKKLRVRKYLAADIMLLKVNYDTGASFTTDTGKNAVYYNDDYHVNKRNIAANIKYGIQFPVWHFVFDFVGGVGLKYRYVTRSGLINPNAEQFKARHPNIWEATHKAGDEVLPTVTANIRIAYEF